MPASEIILAFILNLAGGIVSGMLIFLLGLRWKWISSHFSREMMAFRHVFGARAVESGAVIVTLDVYQDLRLLQHTVQDGLGVNPPQVPGPGGRRFFKVFPDGHLTAFPGAFQDLLGYCSARAASYLADSLGSVQGISVRVAPDTGVASTWDFTSINVGSSASNVKTNDVKYFPENLWLRDDIGQFTFKDDRIIAMDSRSDKGIVLKLPNPYSPGYAVLVCAGLGEWGTSGAAWYLSKHWRRFSSRFGDHAFLVAVSVTPGSDESARAILWLGEKTRYWRVRSWVRAHTFGGAGTPGL